jgi:acetyl-CoA acetyltransferase
MGDRTPVIVGIGLSDAPVAPELDGLGHHVQAMQRALADCGLPKHEIDGYMGAGGGGAMVDDAVSMAEYLKIEHRWLDGTMVGGSSFEFHVQHAAAAIKDGLCDTVLCTYGSSLLTTSGRMLGSKGFHVPGQRVAGSSKWEAPYGNVLIGSYAMAAQRHMHEYGTRPEHLAQIAVDTRYHASLNPNAMYRDLLTIDDVLDSKMIADPLHKLDCCVISDGGGAFIMTTAERARDLKQSPVYVLGAAATSSHWTISQMEDFTTTAAAVAGPEAFRRAGLTPADVDVLHFYDSFTITALLMLEDLGFCKKGEGGPFVEDGKLRIGGSHPMNPDGGGLSSCHPGMRGIFLLVEACRQLRGQAGPFQVPDANVAVACGSGGWLSCLGVVLLGNQAPA